MAGFPTSEASTLASGDRVGPYMLREQLGRGATGLVYRALREPGGEEVALKILKRVLSRDGPYRQRFLREARVAAEVRHGHLVPVLEAGEADGWTYLAVAYVKGGSLDDLLASDGRLPVKDAVHLAGEVASGLDALHNSEIVHRDVKPGNIMLGPEGAALTDFGLAKGTAYTVLTNTGQMVGTLDYIAPELIEGRPAGPASDIYSLGCVVFECLTGAPPFAAKGVLEVAVAHLEEEPPDPARLRDGVSQQLGWIVLQALEKDPSRRPRTAVAYANMLRAGLS